MPTARNYDPTVTGKTQKPSMWDYVEVLRDVRVVVMIFQYSACFGTDPRLLTLRFPSILDLCSSCSCVGVRTTRFHTFFLACNCAVRSCCVWVCA